MPPSWQKTSGRQAPGWWAFPRPSTATSVIPGLLQLPFGYHSACTAFATEIGNLNSDCKSDLKYWHFNRLMGRSASHIALEVALQTHPNVILIGEEIEEQELTIHQVVRLIADTVVGVA